jgi:enoyl-CoA hydratase/carnithine racemase
MVSQTRSFRFAQTIGERFRNMPNVTIGKVEGRARGGGSEIALAMDMCFAAVGKAVFGQPEVAVGLVPGGGSTQRLPRLIGRGRALAEGLLVEARESGLSVASEVTQARVREALRVGAETYVGESWRWSTYRNSPAKIEPRLCPRQSPAPQPASIRFSPLPRMGRQVKMPR